MLYTKSMLVLASQVKNSPILSIRNGHAVAQTGDMLVDADRLEVAAIFCTSGSWRKNNHVLLLRDIREFSHSGLIIDSLEDIEDIGEIVRLNDLVNRNYQVIGKAVVTENGTKLGKVEDYSIDTISNLIQKLYIKPSLLKNLMVNNLVVDRANIIRTDDKQIVVSDATLKSPAPAEVANLEPI